jgi:predicted kinase
MKTAIVDIDGTLADCRHRLYHVMPGQKRDWDAFFSKMDEDDLIEPVASVVRSMAEQYKIVLCSGRPENYRSVTEAWLDRYAIPRDALYMRPANDTRPDHIVKAQILGGIREDGYEPFVVIDDRQSVVDMWREQGLICLQTAPGVEGFPPTAVLTLMVGPSGGGKSCYVRDHFHPTHVISSDQYRADLCGDFKSQDKNNEVFAAVHETTRSRLRHGLPVVIDATHLRRKDRMTAAQLVPAQNEVRYIVINRSMEEKRRDGGWRNEVKDRDGAVFDLLAKHEQTFNSQIKDILSGDGLPNVTVTDLRSV